MWTVVATQLDSSVLAILYYKTQKENLVYMISFEVILTFMHVCTSNFVEVKFSDPSNFDFEPYPTF